MHLQLDESICVANMYIFINPFHAVHSFQVLPFPNFSQILPTYQTVLLFYVFLSKKIKTSTNKTKIPTKILNKKSPNPNKIKFKKKAWMRFVLCRSTISGFKAPQLKLIYSVTLHWR